MKIRGAVRTLAIAVPFLALAAVNAQAQTGGDKVVRLVTASGAGSGTDLAARAISDKLGEVLGTTVIVENKPGAQGRIAGKYVLDAPADGRTLYTFSSADVVAPALTKNYPYDVTKVFAAIAPLASVPNILVVAPNSGFRSVKDVVNAAKADPGKLTYASVGIGSASFMNAEMLRKAAGITLLHVPYKSAGDAAAEVVGERVSLAFSSTATALPFIQSGKLSALAVASDQRSPLLPNVPTLAEAGYPNAVYTFWIGLVTAANTPAPVLDRIATAVKKVQGDADVRHRLEMLGYSMMSMPRADFAAFIRSEVDSSAALISSAGIKPE